MAKSTRKQPGVAQKAVSAGPLLVPAAEPLHQIVDELGMLRAILDAHELKIAPLVAKEKLLTSKLLSRFEGSPADQIQIAEGEHYTVKIGAKAEEQSVMAGGLKKVFGWVGADRFIERAKLTFEQLKGLLTYEQYTEVVQKARTGRRSLTVIPKVAMELPPAA